MANIVQRRRSTFVVDFGDVEIPSALAKELETEVQTLALRTLARIDYRGNLRFGRLPIGTWGLIFGDWPPPWLEDDRHGSPQVRIEDHTIIIDAVMTHGLALARIFASERKAGRDVSEEAVLAALTQLPFVDQRARSSSAAILNHLHGATARDALGAKAKKALGEIESRIDSCETLEELDDLLIKLCLDSSYAEVGGLSISLELASVILRSGRQTIYSPDHPFYQGLSLETGTTVLAKDNKDAEDVAKSDVKGAIKGGVAGSAGGPEGAVVGVIVGSCMSSLKSVVSKLWDSLF